MGREQDLLNAGKNGNVAQIERILSQRNRRSGIHSFISRNVSPNFQDDMGYTALHYAAMNGHKSAVELLLKYDASANIPDNSGNSPLHLAAFNGHAEVARILINLGPSRANVNEQNGTEDTALHSAAQYDHNQVVAVLLENHGDPFIRNCRQESALDLAAQYGRMEPVKLLLSYHPNLLQSFAKTHTPLHLAARNGHVGIVSFLLSCGMDVNTQCDSGTALHDAALFGKLDVVNLLLQCGVDLQVKNKDNLTVMDLLMTHPSTRTQEISKTIYNYSQNQTDTLPRIPMGNSLTRANTAIGRKSSHTEYDTPKPFLTRPDSGGSLKRSDTYDVVSIPRTKKEMRGMSYDSVPDPRPVETQDYRQPYESHQNGVLSTVEEQSLPEGYCLLQGVNRDLQASVTAPMLSQEEVKQGYSILRTPIHPGAKDPLPITDMVGQDNIAYLMVGSGQSPTSQDQLQSKAQGKIQIHPKTLDKQPDPGYYDYVAKPAVSLSEDQTRIEQRDNIQRQSIKSNNSQADIGFYDFVGSTAEKSKGQDQNQDYTECGFYDFVGSSPQQGKEETEKPVQGITRSSTKRTSHGAVNPQGTYDLVNIPAQSNKSHPQVQKSNFSTTQPQTCYDTISFPPRTAASDSQTSDISSQSVGEEIFQEGEIYEPVAKLDQVRHGSDNHCPLDVPDYEQVTVHAIRKQQSQRGQPKAEEEKAFAFFPGYEPMGPSESSPDVEGTDYEFVCLPSHDKRDSYISLKPPQESDTQITESLFQLPSSGIQQRRTGSIVSQETPLSSYEVPPPRRNENLETQTYEVPPLAQNTHIVQGPTVYEVPPPIRSTQQPIYDRPPSGPLSSYEIAPTPRPRTKVPPDSLDLTRRSSKRSAPPTPQENENSDLPPLPPRPQEPQVQPLIEKEHDTPKVPPRRMNEYSQVAIGVKQPATSTTKKVASPSGQPWKPGAYEEVRPEGPVVSATGDAIDWSRIQLRNQKNDGGEYCALATCAVGTMGPPPILPRRSSDTCSSTSSAPGENLLSPDFPPPSPHAAEQEIHRILSEHKSHLPSGETIPEKCSEYSVVKKRRKPKDSSDSVSSEEFMIQEHPPAISPRVDSLYDEEFEVDSRPDSRSYVSNEHQDPFSHPPSGPTVGAPLDNVEQSAFAALHNKFSPHNSRENLVEEVGKQDKDEDETSEELEGGALIYENVLFKRSEPPKVQPQSSPGVEYRTGNLVKSPGFPEHYRLSSLSSESPLDESEEWKKIEEFLSAIGQIEVPETLEDQIADAGKAKTVGEWLSVLQLSEYESALMSNGFDDLDFMNCSILEDRDLLEIGITDPAHRKIILEAVKSLPVPPWRTGSGQSSSEPSSLTEWLESIRLPEYFQVFNHNGYNTMERIRLLWELELTAVLEINTLGHRKRMLVSLEGLVSTVGNIANETTNLEGNVDLEAKLAELRVYCPDEAKQDKLVYQSTQGAVDVKDAGEKNVKSENKAKKGKWKHDPAVLMKGCANYTISYLGSHLVKTITGIESTVAACKKMKASTAKLQKLPAVQLSVSASGIKFIDARSQILVSFHDVKNISYITQDPDEKQVFAYIAKDSKMENHYCHVFRALSNDLSDEITMTIGQAFELAYQQYMHIQYKLEANEGLEKSIFIGSSFRFRHYQLTLQSL